jgi:hypothetical protein
MELCDVKTMIGCLALTMVFAIAPMTAEAKGCVKGAIVGGVAGHYAGHHGFLGAAAGCIVGHHMANHHTQTPSRDQSH